MVIERDFSLKQHNTFGIDTYANFFISASSISEIEEALLFKHKNNLPLLILGGGSNVLFTKPFKGLVLHINLKGIEILEKSQNQALVSAQAGENWHEFVRWNLANDFGGLENLSLIPGNVGTAPIQNIGAYGVEIKDTLHSVKFIEIETGKEQVFSKTDCLLGYRESIFKKALLGKTIITEVTYALSTQNHLLKISYGSINQELVEIKEPTIKDVSDAVIKIRQSKLPDPKKQGNAGSFFKNPIVSKEEFLTLKNSLPDLVGYPDKNEMKLAAGWLIEKAGWKGKAVGNAAVHSQQALVLINLGQAKGNEIYDLSEEIKTHVLSKFGIKLETEVNII